MNHKVLSSDSTSNALSRPCLANLINTDLQKAFDTVDHSILCKKIEGMGVVSIDWFKSYLADRQQVVNINSVTSSPGHVKGVYLGHYSLSAM